MKQDHKKSKELSKKYFRTELQFLSAQLKKLKKRNKSKLQKLKEEVSRPDPDPNTQVKTVKTGQKAISAPRTRFS